MTSEEIRQKAIECGKADLEFCSEHHCDDCGLIDVNPCNHVRAYEHGFADGVEEGKRLGVIEALKPYDAESVEDLVWNVRIKTIEEIISTLAQSEDTILTDKQYYTLMGMKEGAE